MEGTYTPPYFGESDQTGTPIRRPAAANATDTKQLDPALAVLTAVTQALPADRHRAPDPLSSRKRTCSDMSPIASHKDLLPPAPWVFLAKPSFAPASVPTRESGRG